MSVLTFQDVVMALERFWAAQGCVIEQPYDLEVGAGTMHPATFLRALGPEPWRVAFVQPSRRPADGRYGENPNRLFKHYQYQVVLKPSPDDIQDRYLRSLVQLGIRLREHDVRFLEDDWEAPTLGASGLGWQVFLDGAEISQFTYFQQMGGLEAKPVSVEITYGLERITMFIQRRSSAFEIEWAPGMTYGELRLQDEAEQSAYSLDRADVETLRAGFTAGEPEASRPPAGWPWCAWVWLRASVRWCARSAVRPPRRHLMPRAVPPRPRSDLPGLRACRWSGFRHARWRANGTRSQWSKSARSTAPRCSPGHSPGWSPGCRFPR